MPSGLDGNPDPITSAPRRAVLTSVADALVARRTASVLRVAIDGIDGAGKTTFADEVAAVLDGRGGRVIRATTDSFHHPQAVRYRKGRYSPEGFYRDSHDLDALETNLLAPLRADPPRPFRRAGFDDRTDAPVEAPQEIAEPGDILLFDGLFLCRPELLPSWDYVIWVDGESRVRDERLAAVTVDCPAGPAALLHLARWWVMLARYADGQRMYISECNPKARADMIIDNNDLCHPTVRFVER